MALRFALGARHGTMFDQMLKACEEEAVKNGHLPFSDHVHPDPAYRSGPMNTVGTMRTYRQDAGFGTSYGACPLAQQMSLMLPRNTSILSQAHPDMLVCLSTHKTFRETLDDRRGYVESARSGTVSRGTVPAALAEGILYGQMGLPDHSVGMSEPIPTWMTMEQRGGVGDVEVGTAAPMGLPMGLEVEEWFRWSAVEAGVKGYSEESAANVTLLSPEGHGEGLVGDEMAQDRLYARVV
jgi:hypothetical protein